jgi:uncharacterized SAM-binding protein YcdF (DUF218 family)
MADAALRETLLVSALVVLLTAGLALLLAWLYVIRSAMANNHAGNLDWLVVCGHTLDDGQPSVEYRSRLTRAELIAGDQPALRLLLTGGGQPSEAAVGQRWLERRNRIDPGRMTLDESSRDTFENLRQARLLVPEGSTMGVLSSRYHLARIRLYADQLGLAVRPVPAESRWRFTAANIVATAGEAVFVCWFVVGRLWAKMLGRKALLDRIS